MYWCSFREISKNTTGVVPEYANKETVGDFIPRHLVIFLPYGLNITKRLVAKVLPFSFTKLYK